MGGDADAHESRIVRHLSCRINDFSFLVILDFIDYIEDSSAGSIAIDTWEIMCVPDDKEMPSEGAGKQAVVVLVRRCDVVKICTVQSQGNRV